MPTDNDAKGRAWRLFMAAHSRILERIEAALAAAGLPPLAWYDVLWELEKAADAKLRMHELADRVVLSRSNLTRLADRLEKAHLIQREACPDDRRGAFCVITVKGRDMRQQMWTVYSQQIDQRFAKYLDPAEADVMINSFTRMLRVPPDT